MNSLIFTIFEVPSSKFGTKSIWTQIYWKPLQKQYKLIKIYFHLLDKQNQLVSSFGFLFGSPPPAGVGYPIGGTRLRSFNLQEAQGPQKLTKQFFCKYVNFLKTNCLWSYLEIEGGRSLGKLEVVLLVQTTLGKTSGVDMGPLDPFAGHLWKLKGSLIEVVL